MNDGTVLFRALGLDRTLVTLRLDGWSPTGQAEAYRGARRFLERQVAGDLRRFKDLVEERLVPPGPVARRRRPGRGTVHGTTYRRVSRDPAIECNPDGGARRANVMAL